MKTVTKVMIVLGLVMVLVSGMIVVGFTGSGGKRNEKSLVCPTFPAGILFCKEQMKIREGWANAQNFKYEPEWRQREIKKEVNQLLVDSSKKSYQVVSQGNLPSDFDNKVTDIYFIPAIERVGEEEYTRLYGAILYEEKGFKGKSQIICKYTEYTGGVFTVEHKAVGISGPSSIKPFQLAFGPDPNCKVTLYGDANFNAGWAGAGLGGPGEKSYFLPGQSWYKDFADIVKDLGGSPKSIKIKGELLAILLTADGRSETFFNETDENLLDNDNIVNLVPCSESPNEKNREPAVTGLIIISGKVY